MNPIRLVVAITGASGSVYGQQLIQRLSSQKEQVKEVAVVFSDMGKEVWKFETGADIEIPFKIYDVNDFYAPFASGSSVFDCMVICPCSMGTLGKIAGGISDNLITRSADVMLKERRKLILVTRESPLSLIHINNMKTVTEAGGIIYPACPSFYSKPKDIPALVNTVVERVLVLCGLEMETFHW
jgi:flavin prenyltransferase